MNKRLNWLDIGKGLGMLLVMLGHADIPTLLKTYIYTFHMPFFFFLSGYLFKLDKFPNLKVFIFKRAKSLLLPYLCFSLVAYLWFLFVYHLKLVDYHNNLFTPLVGTFVAIRKSDWTVHTGALWFVACLFCTELLFYMISKVGRTKKMIGFLLIAISVLGCLYNKMGGQPLPWNFDVAMVSVGFYGVGFFYKEFQTKLERLINVKVFVLLITTNILAGYFNFVLTGDRVDFYNSSLGNIFLFYVSAFTGIGAFVVLIKHIKRSKSLQYIGKNSLVYLALHQKIVFLLISLMIHKTVLDYTNLIHIPMVKGLLYTLIAVFILVPAVYSINHYLPFMLGKITRKNSQQIFSNLS
jgi:acyltransferase